MSGDVLRERVVAALARRAEAAEGELRDRLLQRLAHWRDGATDVPTIAPAAPSAGALADLRALVDRLGRVAPGRGAPVPASAGAPAPLKAATAFAGTWTRLRADRRLREALAQVPAQAGPLNSSRVVHRALQAMHTLSPAYLDAFLRHADALLWLERSAGLGELAAAAKKPRKR